jgi:hypothetical protein
MISKNFPENRYVAGDSELWQAAVKTVMNLGVKGGKSRYFPRNF